MRCESKKSLHANRFWRAGCPLRIEGQKMGHHRSGRTQVTKWKDSESKSSRRPSKSLEPAANFLGPKWGVTIRIHCFNKVLSQTHLCSTSSIALCSALLYTALTWYALYMRKYAYIVTPPPVRPIFGIALLTSLTLLLLSLHFKLSTVKWSSRPCHLTRSLKWAMKNVFSSFLFCFNQSLNQLIGCIFIQKWR